MIWKFLIKQKIKRLKKSITNKKNNCLKNQFLIWENLLTTKKVKYNFYQYKYALIQTKIIAYQNTLQKMTLASKWSFFKYGRIQKKLNKNLALKLYFQAQSSPTRNNSQEELVKAVQKANHLKRIQLSLRALIYLFLIFYALITLYPFIWAVAGSFRPQTEFANAGFNPFPEVWTTEAYQYLFTNKNSYFSAWIWNSIWTSLLGVVVNIILNIMAGYALARFKFKGKNQIFWTILALSMVPAQVLMIPNFLIVKSFSLYNNLWALIIPSAVNIGYIFMSRQFFLNFPKEIEEAAAIDGMSRLRTLWKIIVPLMRPLVVTQAIFLFMGFWNNFLNARIYISSEENFTLTVGIQNLVSANIYNIEYGQILAASTISIIPVFLIYASLNGIILKGQRNDDQK